jgi:hypothetical protein
MNKHYENLSRIKKWLNKPKSSIFDKSLYKDLNFADNNLIYNINPSYISSNYTTKGFIINMYKDLNANFRNEEINNYDTFALSQFWGDYTNEKNNVFTVVTEVRTNTDSGIPHEICLNIIQKIN